MLTLILLLMPLALALVLSGIAVAQVTRGPTKFIGNEPRLGFPRSNR